MKTVSILTLVLFGLIAMSNAQECGPSCPVCSGTGESGSGLLTKNNLLVTGIYIPTGEEELGVVNLRYGLFKWMDIGAGYTIKAEKPIWSIRFSPVTENEDGWRPGMIVGTGSVQTGGSDQSAYVQLTKSREFKEGYAIRLSGGVASLIPDFNKVYGIAGLTLTVTERFSPFASYDGNSFHVGAAWIPTDWLTVGAILVEMEYPALSLGYRFNFSKAEEKE